MASAAISSSSFSYYFLMLVNSWLIFIWLSMLSFKTRWCSSSCVTTPLKYVCSVSSSMPACFSTAIFSRVISNDSSFRLSRCLRRLSNSSLFSPKTSRCYTNVEDTKLKDVSCFFKFSYSQVIFIFFCLRLQSYDWRSNKGFISESSSSQVKTLVRGCYGEGTISGF